MTGDSLGRPRGARAAVEAPWHSRDPAIGRRPVATARLREMIPFTRSFPNLWFATGTQAAQAGIATHESA